MKHKMINYISVGDRIYEIMNSSPFYKVLEAIETNLSVSDVSDEVRNVNEFKDYKIRLIHNSGESEIIVVGDWQDKHDLKRINPIWSDEKFDKEWKQDKNSFVAAINFVNETTLSIEDIIVKCLRVISLKMGLIWACMIQRVNCPWDMFGVEYRVNSEG